SLRIRAMRQLAFVCATPALGGGLGQIVLAVRTTPIYGNRQTFKQGDSILVYWEGNPTSRNDDQWLPAQLQKDPDPGFCADSNVAVTADSSQVAQIQIVLRARTAAPIRGPNGVQTYKVDSIVTRVALRNNPRCGPGSMPPRPCG